MSVCTSDRFAQGPASFELVVRHRGEVSIVSLDVDAEVFVGRASDVAIHVVADTVAERHLAVRRTREGVFVTDLGSAGGTWLVRHRPPALTTTADGASSSGRPCRLTPHQAYLLQWEDTVWVGPATLGLPGGGRSPSLVPTSARPANAPRVLIDPVMKRIYSLVSRAAATDIAVLIVGETGTGKEALAQTVHHASPRCEAPFLQLNCAALSESLLESELFGHEKGAFTGAAANKAGLLEATDGGTVVLDELGELGLNVQAKLLRVLENREVLRVGATKARRIDVRFVSSTNRDLCADLQQGRFRSDLYYRVSGLTVRIPPLRDRPTELGPLARLFVREFCASMTQRPLPLLPSAHELMRAYHWPGNVRELKNVMERAVLLAEQHPIGAEHLILDSAPLQPSITSVTTIGNIVGHTAKPLPSPSLATPGTRPEFSSPPIGTSKLPPPGSDAWEVERERIACALEVCGGNQTRAAELLGVSRRTLINRLEQFKLPRPQKR